MLSFLYLGNDNMALSWHWSSNDDQLIWEWHEDVFDGNTSDIVSDCVVEGRNSRKMSHLDNSTCRIDNNQMSNCHWKRKEKQNNTNQNMTTVATAAVVCRIWLSFRLPTPNILMIDLLLSFSHLRSVHWYMISASIWLTLLHYYNRFTVLWIEIRSRHLPGLSFWQPCHSSTRTPLCKFTWHESNTGVGGFGLAGSPPWLVGGGLVSELVVGRRVGGLAARDPWLPVRRSILRRVTGEREDG